MPEHKRQAIPIDEWRERKMGRRRFLKRVTIGESEHTLKETAIDSLVFAVAGTGVSGVLEKMGVHGNSNSLVNSFKSPNCRDGLNLIADVAVATPIGEEALNRFVPSLLVRDFSKIRWGAGITSSLIFAALHNLSDASLEDGKLNLEFRTKNLPILQFGAGLFFWKMLRERGPVHAILSHSILNLLGATSFVVKECLRTEENA